MKAAIYVRISSDPQGLRAGVQRQEEDARKLCEAAGWEVAEVYADNDTSAYIRSIVDWPTPASTARAAEVLPTLASADAEVPAAPTAEGEGLEAKRLRIQAKAKRITIHKTTRRGPGLDKGRVEIDWR